MSKHLRNLGEYNKAVVGVLSSASGAVAALLGLGDVIPETVSGWLTSAAVALTGWSVWAVRNQDRIDRLGDTGADLLED